MKKKGKPFTLHRCWKELEHEEKWKNQELYEISNRKNSKCSGGKAAIIICEDKDASSDEYGERGTTPNFVSGSIKLVDGRKYAKDNKGKKAAEIEITTSLDTIVNARNEYTSERLMRQITLPPTVSCAVSLKCHTDNVASFQWSYANRDSSSHPPHPSLRSHLLQHVGNLRGTGKGDCLSPWATSSPWQINHH